MTDDLDALLDAAVLPERSVPLCLRGDLQARFEELEDDLATAQKAALNSLGAGEEVATIAAQIEDLRQQMKAHTRRFRLRALPRRTFRALIAAHPPRRVDSEAGELAVHEDDRAGVNAETFYEELIRASLVPQLTEGQWGKLDAALTDRQYEDLQSAAWFLNRGEIDVPFSRSASRINRVSSGG